jgi:hypothetical protein
MANTELYEDNYLNEAASLRELLNTGDTDAYLAFMENAMKSNRKKSEQLYNPGNMLFDLHVMIAGLPVLFREQVCKECNFTVPTYYRYMRPTFRMQDDKKIMVIENFSNADKIMIRKVFDIVFKVFFDYYVSLQKSAKSNAKG